MKVLFIHGNGGCTASHHWYQSTARGLSALGLEVILETFPDNVIAHQNVWLEFMEKHLAGDNNAILIGHSSGALAAMRYAESHSLIGSVLVSACHTDLGDPNEKASGFYEAPWQWDAIKANQQWIIQFHSEDDYLIPVDEARYVRDQLTPDYFEFKDRGHFMGSDSGGKQTPRQRGTGHRHRHRSLPHSMASTCTQLARPASIALSIMPLARFAPNCDGCNAQTACNALCSSTPQRASLAVHSLATWWTARMGIHHVKSHCAALLSKISTRRTAVPSAKRLGAKRPCLCTA